MKFSGQKRKAWSRLLSVINYYQLRFLSSMFRDKCHMPYFNKGFQTWQLGTWGELISLLFYFILRFIRIECDFELLQQVESLLKTLDRFFDAKICSLRRYLQKESQRSDMKNVYVHFFTYLSEVFKHFVFLRYLSMTFIMIGHLIEKVEAQSLKVDLLGNGGPSELKV